MPPTTPAPSTSADDCPACLAGMPCSESATASGAPLTRAALEGVLGFPVVDLDKYVSVFTHKSAARATGRDTYERYEFIGDALLNFVVAKYLFDRFPDADEGFLTKVRTKLVSGKYLAGLAGQLGLHDMIIMNHKAIRKGWHRNSRIMEDVFESLVGCVYLDLGMMAAKNFVLAVIERYSDFDDVLMDTNYKDALMRYSQTTGMSAPEYLVLNDPQLTRRPLFDVCVVLEGVECGRGKEVSKKGAEQLAAQQALCKFGKTHLLI